MRNIPKSATSIEDLTSTKRVVGTAMAMVLPFLCQVIRSGVDSYFGRLKRPSKKIAKIPICLKNRKSYVIRTVKTYVTMLALCSHQYIGCYYKNFFKSDFLNFPNNWLLSYTL